jgi:hypothetical protein
VNEMEFIVFMGTVLVEFSGAKLPADRSDTRFAPRSAAVSRETNCGNLFIS